MLTIEQWGLDTNALINDFFHSGLLKVTRGEELTIMQKDLGSGWTSVRNSEEQVIKPQSKQGPILNAKMPEYFLGGIQD